MPIKYFLSVDHALINKNSHISLSQVVSLVADSHKLPLVGSFTEGMSDIDYCVIQIESHESVRDGKPESIVNLVIETEDLGYVAFGSFV
jgi:hypothetical protein